MSVNLKELAKFIKICRISQVTEVKIGEIEIKFQSRETPEAKELVSEIPIPSDHDLKEAQSNSVVQQNVESAEDRMDHMHVEDPVMFERLLVERELEDNEAAHH